MPQFINFETPGDKIQRSLTTGITDLINGLTKKSQQNQYRQALKQENLPEVLSFMDPNVQAAYLKEYGASQKRNELEQRAIQEQNFIESLKEGGFGQLAQQDMQQFSPQNSQPLGFSEEILNNLLNGAQRGGMSPALQTAPELKPSGKVESKPIKESSSDKIRSYEHRLSKENENLEKALSRSNITSGQKGQIRQAIQKNRDELSKIREYRDKTFGTELGEVRSQYKAARDQNEDLNRFKELEDEGLVSNKLTAFLKGLGVDNIGAILNPQSEEYEKLSQSFIRNARNIYGNRLTNYDVEQFLKTIPTLMNSPEGRKRVISQMERLNNMKIATYKVAEDIIKKNGGIPPENLWEKVDKKLDKKREGIIDQFKKDLKRKVPKGDSRLTTGLSYAAGRLTPPLTGALIGSRFGVPGAILGGVAGAAPYLGSLLGGLRGGSSE